MKNQPKNKAKKFMWAMIITLLLLTVTSMLIAIYGASTGKEVITPTGIVVNGKNGNDGRGILREYRDGNGDRIVVYTDGTSDNIGHLPPLAPTNAQVATAIKEYCENRNSCAGEAGKNVTTTEVTLAVEQYCSKNNGCAGTDGADGANATPEQIATAVNNYCKDGGCVGATGAAGTNGTNGTNGTDGSDGKTPQIGCVVKPVNGQPQQFIAWKYTDETNSAWRNLQQITNGQGCIVLQAALTPATPTN